MQKEPLSLYLFRFVLAFGLFAFMAMLYWSSLLVEEDLKIIKTQLQQLKEQTRQTKSAVSESATPRPASTPSAAPLKRTHIDPALTNLLKEDPFYAETLPKLLGPTFKPQGVSRGATIGRPDDLHPFSNWAQSNAWTSQCLVGLARLEFGKYETMAPDMAIKIEERQQQGTNVPEFWVHLRDGVYWQPLNEGLFEGKVTLAPHFLQKHQVTAEDFKFWFDAMMNPHLQAPGAVSWRTYYGDLEKIEVIDPLTFVVRWKPKEFTDAAGQKEERINYIAKQLTGGLRPLASFLYKYFPDGTKIVEDDQDPETYRTNSVWAQNFVEHWAKNIIACCGGWIFEGMTERQISFRRNPDHYFPLDVLIDREEAEFKNTTDAIWQDFKIGRIDSYTLQPDQMIELENFLQSPYYQEQEKSGNSIEKLQYNARSYNYIGWNQARPFFKSEKVRQAMTLAIDRTRIIQQYLNGMGAAITGPFAHDSPAYDKSIVPWPFDVQAAKYLLEEEGWIDSDGDGVLDKMIDGKRVPFAFSLTYFVKNPTTKSICEYVATALKEIGVQVKLNGVDMADLSAAIDEKNFDALYMGWALGTPPEDPRQLWHSSGAKEPGSSNTIGFSNAEVDKIIDQLTFENDQKKRLALYHRFHAIIHQEQPYTFLYAPKTTFLYRSYLQNVFIPAERQDLVPGADVAQPIDSVFWIKKK